ncbi:MAG: tetratricopeptide repeat protein [Lentisphaeria bacterium]|nr:tetratricopeptide repeat protein [Lentisphaeria bacterium]
MVKIPLRQLMLTAVLGAAAVLSADEAVQRRLGDSAFYAGDYRNAISSYVSAMELADKENKPDGWAASALNLGVAYLHNGDIAGARKVYEEFRRRYPLRSAGTLPGDLLAAEGKTAEAEKFFQALLSGNAPEMEDAARFSLAMLYLKSGRLSEANKIFSQLAEKKSSPWAASARNEMLYTLIRLNRCPEALAKIGEIPPEKRNADVELMRYLAEVYSGNTENLEKNFQTFLNKMPPAPHVRLMELLSQAAVAAEKAGKYEFAVESLQQALSFAVDRKIKQHLHKLLVKTMLSSSPEKAAMEAKEYSKIYPDAADRAQVIMGAASGQKDQKNLALGLYSFIIDGDFTPAEKVAAAMAAVNVTEAAADFSGLAKISRFLTAQLPLEKKLAYQCRYAAFLEKSGKLSLAEKELKSAFENSKSSNFPASKEKVMLELLNFYIRQNNTARIKFWALKLENSSSPACRRSAKIALGKALDKEGDPQTARKKFIEAAQAVPSLAAEAEFMAAAMAAKSFDYATAAAEFAALAAKYPDFLKTPEALFMAADLYSTVNDPAKANMAAEMLQKKYAASEAFAAMILRNAAARGNSGDIAGALEELQQLEKKFASSPVADEAAMMRAVFLLRNGNETEAVKIFSRLANSSNAQHAAESSCSLGEIYFSRGKLTEAFQAFINASIKMPGSLLADVSLGRAGDCLRLGKAPLPPENIATAAEIFEKLATSSRFPHIRLQALWKLGDIYESQGKSAEALTRYEQVIYAALAMIEQGMLPEAQWCEKACERALYLIAGKREPGAWQRGLRLLERCRSLMLPDSDFIEKQRNEFRKNLKQRR